jgi:hypothetical protein
MPGIHRSFFSQPSIEMRYIGLIPDPTIRYFLGHRVKIGQDALYPEFTPFSSLRVINNLTFKPSQNVFVACKASESRFPLPPNKLSFMLQIREWGFFDPLFLGDFGFEKLSNIGAYYTGDIDNAIACCGLVGI